MDAPQAQRPALARTFHHSRFRAQQIAAVRTCTISVCLPARAGGDTIGSIVPALVALRDAGVLDEVAVVDPASQDGTAQVASSAGATVHQEAQLMAHLGPVLGKGDAMYRALSV